MSTRRVCVLLRGAAVLGLVAAPGVVAAPAHANPSASPSTPQCRLQDPRLTEASSLVDLGRWLVTADDSGHGPRLFVLDPSTCATVGVTTYAGSVTDVESMAPAGPRAVWVGDTGDNDRARSEVAVFRVQVATGRHVVAAPRYRLAYPDGPHDAEALVARHGRLYVVTKGILAGAVYAAPRQLSPTAPNRLRRLATVPGMVTDAALLPSGDGVLLRDYSRGYLVTLPGWRLRGSFPLPRQQQGEAISAGPGGRVLVTSEGEGARVLRVRVPGHLLRLARPRAAAAPVPAASVRESSAATPTVTPTATPSSSAGGEGDRSGPGPKGNPLPLLALAVVVLGAGWGLRRLRRSRMR